MCAYVQRIVVDETLSNQSSILGIFQRMYALEKAPAHWYTLQRLSYVGGAAEVCFSRTSVRSAQLLPQHMRFGGAADLGFYNTK